MQHHLCGLIAATYTPFTQEGSLNLEIVPCYAALLRTNKVDGAFVCGTTGEFSSLTLAERRDLVDAWLSAAGALPIIVHVGDTALANARALAAHAAEAGAAAIACMAPSFFKPQSVSDLVAWCVAVASAAPSLPFYYYHMPSMNGVSISVPAFLEAAAKCIPSFAGIKYSHEDMEEFSECVRLAAGKLNLLMGRDELLLEGLERGAQGAVGSTYNYAAPLYTQMILHHGSGAVASARASQQKAKEMIAVCSSKGVSHIAASKGLMAMLGVDCGPVRMPLSALDEEHAEELRATLECEGFFDFACQPSTMAME